MCFVFQFSALIGYEKMEGFGYCRANDALPLKAQILKAYDQCIF
jgi:hypothetical protein